MPVTTRGAGTSCAGNAVGPGLVVDTARHLNRIVSIDPEARTAVVEPGVVQALCSARRPPHGLRFGPDPSTHTRCTIGGMIGNNACGPRALGYGRTADNVVALDVITGRASGCSWTRRRAPTAHRPELRSVAGRRPPRHDPDRVRPVRPPGVAATAWSTCCPRTAVDLTVPGRHRRHARCHARGDRRLVADPPHKLMIALGYPTMADAADAVPDPARRVLADCACEGLDRRIVDVVRAPAGGAVPPLPAATGGCSSSSSATTPRGCGRAPPAGPRAGALDASSSTIPPRPPRSGRSVRTAPGWPARQPADPAYAGWEDAAVPPAELGSYLRDFDALLDRAWTATACRTGTSATAACTSGSTSRSTSGGRRRYREFLSRRPRPGGGLRRIDVGRARRRPGALGAAAADVLRRALRCSGRSRRSSTRRTCSTPACSSTPAARRRPATAGRGSVRTRSGWPTTGSLAAAVHRCTGVGKCLADTTGARRDVPVVPGDPRREGLHPRPGPGASGDDQRRARARLAVPAVTRRSISACPARAARGTAPPAIDMATYKSEVLDQTYGGRLASALPLRARLAAALGAADHAAAGRGDAVMRRPRRPGGSRGGAPAWTSGAPCRVRRESARRGRRSRDVDGTGTRPVVDLGGLVLRLLHAGGGARPRSGCWRGRATRRGLLERRLLRADLDHDRPARRARRRSASLTPCTVRGRAARRSSAWSRPAWRSGAATPPSCSRRPAGRESPRASHAGRAARPDAGLAAARPDRRRPRRPAALPPRRRSSAGRPTRPLLARPARR